LGGDSIVSIQLVSRARRAGVALTPRAVFQHQTVAALARAAGAAAGGRAGAAAAALPGGGPGGVGATPVMCWPAGPWRAARAVQPGDAGALACGAAAAGP